MPAATLSSARQRDIRLDFFRGIAMMIILIAHVPGNAWTLWIPARFGFSDATEMFVFCSGLASALAFGRRYETLGWKAGSLRVVKRMWQVYQAHILLFAIVLALVLAFNASGLSFRNYLGQLNLYPFVAESERWDVWVNRISFFTLTYVPNYFDILPMYLVVLALVPVVMALAGLSTWFVAAGLVVLWLGAQSGLLWLPAEPWSSREWFFNPFGWQLLFFTGFAFGMGWLRAPRFSWVIAAVALMFVLASVPPSSSLLHRNFAWAAEMREVLLPFRGKTDFGVLRYLHFLALAYLAYHLAGHAGSRIAKLWQPLRVMTVTIGQQALIVFVTSMALARFIGFMLDLMGRSALTFALLNLSGIAFLYMTARIAQAIKKRLKAASSDGKTLAASPRENQL
jgi:hypothetical protein